MTYGILASQSCLLSKIAHALQEDQKKIYTVDRLSGHLKDGADSKALAAYLDYVRKMAPSEPVVHIDDSDVVKPEGYHFETLGIVRDGSKSTNGKSVYTKGYHVTEACVLADSNHPVSIFSRIHSPNEKGFTSANHITFNAIERGAELFKKATYVMDRGYDDNKMFNKLWELGRDFVIRLTRKRKLLFHGKWVSAASLCAQRKGKVKMDLFYKGKSHEAYGNTAQLRLRIADAIVRCCLNNCVQKTGYISVYLAENTLQSAARTPCQKGQRPFLTVCLPAPSQSRQIVSGYMANWKMQNAA